MHLSSSGFGRAVFDAAPPCTAPDCLLCPFPTRPSWLGPDEKLETLRTAPAPRFSSRSLLSRSKFQARPQLEESRVRQRHDLRITAEHDVLWWHIPSPKVALDELHQLAAAPAQNGFKTIQCETARLLKGGLWWKRQLMLPSNPLAGPAASPGSRTRETRRSPLECRPVAADARCRGHGGTGSTALRRARRARRSRSSGSL